jgi:hypothetical protein
MLLLFYRGFWPRLSLIKFGLLDCMAMNVAFPCWTALRMICSGCLSLDFFSGVGPLEQAGSQKWSPEGLVNEQSPAPHRASLWVRNELFSWWFCQFQFIPSFSKAVQCLGIPTAAAELPYPYMGFFSSTFCPFPQGRGEIFPPCVWPPVLSRGGAVSSPAVL